MEEISKNTNQTDKNKAATGPKGIEWPVSCNYSVTNLTAAITGIGRCKGTWIEIETDRCEDTCIHTEGGERERAGIC